MIAHAQEGYPDEVCGLIGGRDGRACAWRALRNADPRPQVRYTLDPEEQLAAFQEFEAQGWELLAVVHSHPAGPSWPSESDITESFYPDVIYLIINLVDRHQPEVTAWWIQDGRAKPADWQIVAR